RFPVMVWPQVWRMHQDVKRFTARRCDLRIGARGSTDVARRVRGGFAFAVNEIELLMRVPRKNKIVVQQVVVTAVKSQVQHDARAGGRKPFSDKSTADRDVGE